MFKRTPIETPMTIAGIIMIDKFMSIILPVPFFKGCGFYTLNKVMSELLRNMLKSERVMAFLASNLKNINDIGKTIPAPAIPPKFAYHSMRSTIKMPQIS